MTSSSPYDAAPPDALTFRIPGYGVIPAPHLAARAAFFAVSADPEAPGLLVASFALSEEDRQLLPRACRECRNMVRPQSRSVWLLQGDFGALAQLIAEGCRIGGVTGEPFDQRLQRGGVGRADAAVETCGDLSFFGFRVNRFVQIGHGFILDMIRRVAATARRLIVAWRPWAAKNGAAPESDAA